MVGKSSATISGDYRVLARDLTLYTNKLDTMTKKEFGESTNRISKFWVKKYNQRMATHPSLAKAKITRTTQYNGNSNQISIPNHAVYFDMGKGHGDKGHFVSLNNSASLRRWVRQNWLHTNDGWRATYRDTMRSKVKGTAANPRGQVFVRSHLAKFGWSIIERTNDETAEYSREELRKTLPQLMKKMKGNLFSRNVYNIQIKINI